MLTGIYIFAPRKLAVNTSLLARDGEVPFIRYAAEDAGTQRLLSTYCGH